MTLDAFRLSLSQTLPPAGLSKLLEALWYDGKQDWTTAHNIAQDISSADGSWVHAYLHRKEGDDGNAAYWYRRAGRPFPQVTVEKEWKEMVAELLSK